MQKPGKAWEMESRGRATRVHTARWYCRREWATQTSDWVALSVIRLDHGHFEFTTEKSMKWADPSCPQIQFSIGVQVMRTNYTLFRDSTRIILTRHHTTKSGWQSVWVLQSWRLGVTEWLALKLTNALTGYESRPHHSRMTLCQSKDIWCIAHICKIRGILAWRMS